MSSNSSNSSKGDLGNTKPKSQDSPKKNWCFTLHKFTSDDIIFLKNFFSSNSSNKFIFSEEAGKSGETPHLQGYFSLASKARFTALIKIFSSLSNKIHLEPARGNLQQNIEYITKEGGVTYENVLPEKVYCEEPSPKLTFLLDLMNKYEFPKGDRLIHVVVDYIGGLGKTEFARYCVLNYADCIVTGGKSADMKNQVLDYYNKKNRFPKYVIIDIPRQAVDYVSYQGIEDIKNMLFYSGKYEGGMICGNKPFILMLMNENPKTEYLSEDRWRIYKISK